MHEPIKLFIIVRGGVVQYIYANTMDTEITVLDYDNKDEENEKELEELEQNIINNDNVHIVY